MIYRCTLTNDTPAVIKTKPDRPDDDEFLTKIDAMILYADRSIARVLKVDRDKQIVLIKLIVPSEPL